MPLDRVDFGSNTIETVEDLFKDLVKIIASATTEELVIVDSLDSLSDDAEMQRDMSEGTYGAQKAKNMSQMFRRLVRQLANSKVTLIIVSQVRDKIGAMGYGRKTTRSGGRALDFYASQVVYLAHIEKLTRTIHNIKRATGVHIKAMVDKNKIGLAFRESEFNINFGFGIDDVTACLTWLKEAKYLKDVDISEKEVKSYHETLMKGSRADYDKELAYLQRAVKKRWYELETSFLPTRKKYG
jgi:RecA/RadA recombinase